MVRANPKQDRTRNTEREGETSLQKIKLTLLQDLYTGLSKFHKKSTTTIYIREKEIKSNPSRNFRSQIGDVFGQSLSH